MTARRRARLCRTLSVAVLLVTAPMTVRPLPNVTMTLTNATRCGHWPEVGLRHDCWITRNRAPARAFMHKAGACIADAEASGWHSRSPRGTYGGRFQLSVSAADSVGPNRLDGIHPADAPRRLQILDARRLYRARGTQPWPPARHC